MIEIEHDNNENHTYMYHVTVYLVNQPFTKMTAEFFNITECNITIGYATDLVSLTSDYLLFWFVEQFHVVLSVHVSSVTVCTNMRFVRFRNVFIRSRSPTGKLSIHACNFSCTLWREQMKQFKSRGISFSASYTSVYKQCKLVSGFLLTFAGIGVY